LARNNGYLAAALLSLTLCSGAYAQSDFLDQDQKGLGVDLGLAAATAGTAALRLGAGYSVNGFVDLGVDVGFNAAEPSTFLLDSYEMALAWRVTILKQDRIVPFTVSLPGTLGKRLYTRADLAEENLIMTGTGYSLGLDVFRYVPLAYRRYIRYGLTAELESWTDLTEDISGDTVAGYPCADSRNVSAFGGIAGVSFRPTVANRGVATSVDLRFMLNSDLQFTLASVVSVTVVENKTERSYR